MGTGTGTRTTQTQDVRTYPEYYLATLFRRIVDADVEVVGDGDVEGRKLIRTFPKGWPIASHAQLPALDGSGALSRC
jgi:hypothetical protein